MFQDTDRSITDVTILDIEKRRFPKHHYVFVAEVSWNDGAQNCVYRNHNDFFSFQINLINSFPIEGGVKNHADRVIPFLPGKVFFGSQSRDVALKRKDGIADYCQRLIKLPQHISQSELVLSFFEPNDEDISSMKKDLSNSNGEPLTREMSKHADVISGPVLLEQYIALADYYELGRGQITLIAGDIIDVIDKDDNGWWFVSREDEEGWVPSSFLGPVEGAPEDIDVEKGNEEKFFCVTKYEAVLDDEIDLDVGSIVQVLQKGTDGWWQVRYKGNIGWAPKAYLKPAPTGDDGVDSTQIKAPPIRSYKKYREAAPPPPRKRTVTKIMQDFPKRTIKRQETIYVTTSDYSIDMDTDVEYGILNIPQGSKVQVLEKAPNGWWYIKVGNEEAWVPASIMERRRQGEEINVSQDDSDEFYGNVQTIVPARGFQNKETLETLTEIYQDDEIYDNCQNIIPARGFQNNETLESLTGDYEDDDIYDNCEAIVPARGFQNKEPQPVVPARGFQNKEPQPVVPARGFQNKEPLESLTEIYEDDEIYDNCQPVVPARGLRNKESPATREKFADIGKKMANEELTSRLRKIPSPVPPRREMVNEELTSRLRKIPSPLPPRREIARPTQAKPAQAPPKLVARSAKLTPQPQNTYTAIKSYTDNDEGMLQLRKGDTVQVLDKDDGEWWLAKVGNNTGWVPFNFLQQNY